MENTFYLDIYSLSLLMITKLKKEDENFFKFLSSFS